MFGKPKQKQPTDAEIVLNELKELDLKINLQEQKLKILTDKIERNSAGNNISDEDFKACKTIYEGMTDTTEIVSLDNICFIVLAYKGLTQPTETIKQEKPKFVKPTCEKCGKELNEGEYYKKKNKLYCMTHLQDDFEAHAKKLQNKKGEIENANNQNFI